MLLGRAVLVRGGAMAARAEAQPALACFWLTDALHRQSDAA